MSFFLIVLLIPLVVSLCSFVFSDGITWKEFLVQVAVQLVIAGSSSGIVSCVNTRDTETWNGRVANKYSQHVSCSHSYPCNPYPCNCNSKGQCSTCWNTCYDHLYDVDWVVQTSNDETVDIDRVDRQGIYQPPRWTAVQLGEPTSLTHSYDNYVKAAPGTLFRHQGLVEKYASSIPEYPQQVYDYYRLNHLVTVGLTLVDSRDWNVSLSELNAKVGKQKQANVIVVLVKDMPDDYFYALEEAWIGGKKNDVILVVSVDAALKPQWAAVLCWTTNELFKVKLRDDVMADAAISREILVQQLHENVTHYFERKPMKDFEYLQSSATPTLTEWWVCLGIGFLSAVGLAILFHFKDVFDEENKHAFKNRRSKRRQRWEDL